MFYRIKMRLKRFFEIYKDYDEMADIVLINDYTFTDLKLDFFFIIGGIKFFIKQIICFHKYELKLNHNKNYYLCNKCNSVKWVKVKGFGG